MNRRELQARTPTNDNVPQRIGRRGEDLAAEYLQGKGYQIVARRYRMVTGELDLICRDPSNGDATEGEIVFVEVKTRTNRSFGSPESGVTSLKKRRLRRTAESFLEERSLSGRPARVDVIAIEFSGSDTYRLKHVCDALGILDGLNVDPNSEWREPF